MCTYWVSGLVSVLCRPVTTLHDKDVFVAGLQVARAAFFAILGLTVTGMSPASKARHKADVPDMEFVAAEQVPRGRNVHEPSSPVHRSELSKLKIR